MLCLIQLREVIKNIEFYMESERTKEGRTLMLASS